MSRPLAALLILAGLALPAAPRAHAQVPPPPPPPTPSGTTPLRPAAPTAVAPDVKKLPPDVRRVSALTAARQTFERLNEKALLSSSAARVIETLSRPGATRRPAPGVLDLIDSATGPGPIWRTLMLRGVDTLDLAANRVAFRQYRERTPGEIDYYMVHHERRRPQLVKLPSGLWIEGGWSVPRVSAIEHAALVRCTFIRSTDKRGLVGWVEVLLHPGHGLRLRDDDFTEFERLGRISAAFGETVSIAALVEPDLLDDPMKGFTLVFAVGNTAERDGRALLEIPARETCTIDALPLR
jgi:hypothetical protein